MFCKASRFSIIIILGLLLLTSLACTHHHSAGKLDIAERIMEEHPDSALSILDAISTDSLSGVEEKARYALLMSVALDKNYIDTPTFNVIQPAIDYYLTKGKGTPDDKLKTLYYQGCIYQTANNNDSAMQCFLRGRELAAITDSLTYARLLVLQGWLFNLQYKYNDFVKNNLTAAKLYHKYNKPQSEVSSYSRALEGALTLENRKLSDSLYKINQNLVAKYPEYKTNTIAPTFSYAIRYGSKEQIRELLNDYQGFNYPDAIKLDIARGYTNIGESNLAIQYFDSITTHINIIDSISYYLLRSEAEEASGLYKNALESYKQCTDAIMSLHETLFNQDLLFAEKKHKLEVANLNEIRKRNLIILIGTGILIIIGIMLFYHQRLIRAKQKLAEQEKISMNLEIEQLMADRDRLQEFLDEQKILTDPIRKVVRKRLDMLNMLLTKEISSNAGIPKDYKKWIESIKDNKDDFIQSTKLAFTASYPKFMKHLDSCGLTENEIGYVCLYAMGLRGKEVGEYINLKTPYKISSQIRAKLNIPSNRTTLGSYIKKLMQELD